MVRGVERKNLIMYQQRSAYQSDICQEAARRAELAVNTFSDWSPRETTAFEAEKTLAWGVRHKK